MAPTTSALYWMQVPDAPAPVTATPVRYDLVSRQVVRGGGVTGFVGSPALTVTGGWVWVVVGRGSEILAEQLDPTTLVLHATHVLAERSAPDPPSPGLTATVDGPLWVAAGEDVWALSPTTGAVETGFTTAGAVASMSTDPTGSLLYVSSQPANGDGGVISEYSAHTGRLLQTNTDHSVIGPGTVAATAGGVWVSVRTGMQGRAFELSSDGLKVVAPINQGFPIFEQTMGVWSGVSEGVLWLSSISDLTCADPNRGAIRASEPAQSDAIEAEGPVVASGHVLYAQATAGGVAAITPPAACWPSGGPGG